MPTTHTVAQGETLTRIAKQYRFGSVEALYNHPDNAEFKQKRPDPNVIFPGDEIIIPDIKPKKMSARAGKSHTFCVKSPKEFLRMQLESASGKTLPNTRVVITMDGEEIDTITDDQGMLELEMTKGTETDAQIDVYLDENSDEPSFSYKAQVTALDPVEELSGVQARCNALGFNCGAPDGVMGKNTRRGVKAFQAAHGLDVDGVPGPKTKAKLKEVYGS